MITHINKNMMSIRIIACLLVIYRYGDIIVAFPSIQQQQQLIGGSLAISTQPASNDVSNKRLPNDTIWRQPKNYILLRNSLRAGAGNSNIVGGSDMSIIERYSRFVDEKPLLAKSLTAGVVTTMANIFSQVVVASQLQPTMNSVLSWRRVIMFMLTGVCFIGPYLHLWYGFLERVLAMPKQKHTTRTVAKVIVDQTVGLCIFFPLYFLFMEIAESMVNGRVPLILTALEKCRTDFRDVAIMNWRIWPITNAINFGVVPLQFRVLVNQLVSFFWFAYLSTRA